MKLRFKNHALLAKSESLARSYYDKLDFIFIAYGIAFFFVFFIYCYVIGDGEEILDFAFMHAPFFTLYYIFNLVTIPFSNKKILRFITMNLFLLLCLVEILLSEMR